MFIPITEEQWINVAMRIQAIQGEKGESLFHTVRGMYMMVERLDEMLRKDWTLTVMEAINELDAEIRKKWGVQLADYPVKE